MKKQQSKRLTLARETLSGLEKHVQGGTGPSYYPCSAPSETCDTTSGGSGDPSNGFYQDPNSCMPRG